MDDNAQQPPKPQDHATLNLRQGIEQYAHFQIYRDSNGLLQTLGSGAMGTTYRAFDTQLERPVALKVISPQHSQSEEMRTRFLREAKAAARLQHPNIASVLYQGDENGTCFYVMELVSGENLEHYVMRNGAMQPYHALQIVHQVALALDTAHKENILHRDLKPSNIMLTSYHEGRTPHVKVIDFGLAKLLEYSGSFATLTGFLGTPGFASPEQCMEEPLDARSDLYSLGITLWFLVSASMPYKGSALSILKAHVYEEPDYSRLPDLPEPVSSVLKHLLKKIPAERPQTALELAYECEQAMEALGGPPVSTAPPVERIPSDPTPVTTQPSRRMRPLLMLGVIGLLTVLVVASLFVMASVRKNQTDTTVPVEEPEEAQTTEASPPTPATLAPAPTASDIKPPVTAISEPEASSQRTGILQNTVQEKDTSIVYTNSLGMRFVRLPLAGTPVSVWETRVSDYRAFIQETGYKPERHMGPFADRSWDHPGFMQGPDHPVVNVSCEDAKAFCDWLTQKERKLGLIAQTQFYRLPGRFEYDIMLGHIPDPEMAPGNTAAGPRQRPQGTFTPGESGNNKPVDPKSLPYHWGNIWPPSVGAGNYADQSALKAGAVTEAIEGYDDGFPRTAPVGRFLRAESGVYDASGNVWEISYQEMPIGAEVAMQGGGWTSGDQNSLKAHAQVVITTKQVEPFMGFRCILAEGPPMTPRDLMRNQPQIRRGTDDGGLAPGGERPARNGASGNVPSY